MNVIHPTSNSSLESRLSVERPAVQLLTSRVLALKLRESRTMERVERISRLPHVHSVTVYPDASPKPFGFPTGIAVRTSAEWFYPLSAPDMGCGYEVVDTGIEVNLEEPLGMVAGALLDKVSGAISASVAAKRTTRVTVRDALVSGLPAAGPPEFFEADQTNENTSWLIDVSLLASADIDRLQVSLGHAAGHFVSVYAVDEPLHPSAPPRGRLVLIVHIGAAPIREIINSRGLYTDLAKSAVDAGVNSVRDAADGLFAVAAGSEMGRAFLGLAMAARNFGYVNRQLVADRIMSVLIGYIGRFQRQSARQLRHVDHVAFELFEGEIRARRGLQPTRPGGPLFVTGGAYTPAYLCLASAGSFCATGGLFPHGAPVFPQTAEVGLANDTQDARADLAAGWATDVIAANTPFDRRQFASDLSNLDELITYTESVGWSTRLARLRPLINYREVDV